MNILCIFDTHVRPGLTDLSYLTDIGNFIVKSKPDVIVHLGDHWDMPSLSSYSFGKLEFEGRRYIDDIHAGNAGMDMLMEPLRKYNADRIAWKKKKYCPKLIYCIGNHDERIKRAVNADAKLEGVIGYHDLNLVSHGWAVVDFLEVIMVNGVCFSHYFTTGSMGRPATSPNAILNRKHMSCVCGHQQGRQVATAFRATGEPITAIICGSSYPHNEDYLGHQGNNHWRGIAILNDVKDGAFDEEFISLKRLKEIVK